MVVDREASRATWLVVGPVEIDLIDRLVLRDGRPLRLRAREYAMLLVLARNAGQVVARPALLLAVCGLRIDPGTNVIDVHVARLRAALDRGFARPLLRTVRGTGYVLDGTLVAR